MRHAENNKYYISLIIFNNKKGNNSVPVHRTSGGGYQWGKSGKVYYGKGAKAKAEKQGRAAYANGYKGK